MRKIVAIDGPAGSGKGTVAKILADKLNLVYIDTGATYRCVALATINNNIDYNDEEKVVDLAKSLDIKFLDNGKVLLNGNDVTKDIRSKEVSKIVSPVSSNVKLRELMVDIQRNMASNNDVIMEGRDITTVVFPNANYKFYLDADLNERAKRRFEQNKLSGIKMSMDEIIDNIKKRDYNDMHKEVGSLIRTDEQFYIDSTNLTIDEVVDKMIKIIERDEE